MMNNKFKINDEVYIKCEYIPGTKIKTIRDFPTLIGIITRIFHDNSINLFSDINKLDWRFEFSDISPIYKRSGILYYDSGEFRPIKRGEYFLDKNDLVYGPSYVFQGSSSNPTLNKYTILKPIQGKKEMTQQQYKILKPITLETVVGAGNTDCFAFREEVTELFKILLVHDMYITAELEINFLEPYFENHPNWRDWLIEKSFIEKIKPEIFYHAGQEFKYENDIWQIITFTSKLAALVNIKGHFKGQVWDGKTHKISHYKKITKEEFRNITDSNPELFELIPDT